MLDKALTYKTEMKITTIRVHVMLLHALIKGVVFDDRIICI